MTLRTGNPLGILGLILWTVMLLGVQVCCIPTQSSLRQFRRSSSEVDAHRFRRLHPRGPITSNGTSNGTGVYSANITAPQYRFVSVIQDFHVAPIQIDPSSGNYIVQVSPSLHFSATQSNTQLRIRMIIDLTNGTGTYGNLAVEVMDFGPNNKSLAISPTGPQGTLRDVQPIQFLTAGANGALLDLITAEGVILDVIQKFQTFTVGQGTATVNDENKFMQQLLEAIQIPLPDAIKTTLDSGTAFAAWWLPSLSKAVNCIYLTDEWGPLRQWRLGGGGDKPQIIYDRLGLQSLSSSNQTGADSSTKQSRRSLKAKNQLLRRGEGMDRFDMARFRYIPPSLANVNIPGRLDNLRARYAPPALNLQAEGEGLGNLDWLLNDIDDVEANPPAGLGFNQAELDEMIQQLQLPPPGQEAQFAAAQGALPAGQAVDNPIAAAAAIQEVVPPQAAFDAILGPEPDFPPLDWPAPAAGAGPGPGAGTGPGSLPSFDGSLPSLRSSDIAMLAETGLLGEITATANPADNVNGLVPGADPNVNVLEAPAPQPPTDEATAHLRSSAIGSNWAADMRAASSLAAQAGPQAAAGGAGPAQAIFDELHSAAPDSPYARLEPLSSADFHAPLSDAGELFWGAPSSSNERYAPFSSDAQEPGNGQAASSGAGDGTTDPSSGAANLKRPADGDPEGEGGGSCSRQRVGRRDACTPSSDGKGVSAEEYDPAKINGALSQQKEASYLVRDGITRVLPNFNPQAIAKSVGALGLAGFGLAVFLVLVDWDPSQGYQSLAIGLAGAVAEAAVAALAPEGPIGWLLAGLVVAVFTILGAFIHNKPPGPGISNTHQIIQFAFFGDRDHTGNENCRQQADEANKQNDCQKAGNPNCSPPSQCEVHYGAGMIAAAFKWAVQKAVAFLVWANRGYPISIPDMADKLVIFKSEDEAAAKPDTVFYVLCDNSDPNLCKNAEFKLADNLVSIPRVNVTADVVYGRLVNSNNEGDCVMLLNPPNGFALPVYGLTVYGRPYGFACNLPATHNFSSTATYNPTDVPVFGNMTNSSLAGDSASIAPAYSLSSDNSNGEAGQAHVDAPPPAPFGALTTDNAACFATGTTTICVPHGEYSTLILHYDKNAPTKVTVPSTGGKVVSNTHYPCSVPNPPCQPKQDTLIQARQYGGLGALNLNPDSIDVTLNVDPPCACLFDAKDFKGNNLWCFGPGGGPLPPEAAKKASSLILRGGAQLWAYVKEYNDNTGHLFTTDVEDLTTVTLTDSTSFDQAIVALWVNATSPAAS